MFAREVKELYLHAKASLESPNADSEDLGTIKIKMEAAVQHLRRLEWALDLTRPCGGDLLELIINQVKQLECKIGEMIETFNGLINIVVGRRAALQGPSNCYQIRWPAIVHYHKRTTRNNALVWFIVDGHSEGTWYVKIFVCYISNTRKNVSWVDFVRRKGCGLVLVWV